MASGAPAAADPAPARLPGRERFPRVDDHIVEPEVTRDQLIGRRSVKKMPAEKRHATKHSELDYVLRAKVDRDAGYCTASDLLTRVDIDSDFASDAAILKDGIDPDTGARYLEQLAFEVVSTQSKSDVREKAERMHRRGVRRIFAIFTKTEQVSEWVPAQRGWKELDRASSIDDPCLVEPLPIEALLDAAAADNAVASALITKDNPVIQKHRAEAEAAGLAKGRAEGKAEGEAVGTARAILSILEVRGSEPSDAVRERVLSCTDPDLLQLWLRRAATTASLDKVLEET